MTTKTRIYLAVALVLLIAAASLAPYLSSAYRIRTADRELEKALSAADEAQLTAAAADRRAAEYKEKLDFLESQLAEVSEIARRQDNELKILNANSNSARRDVDSARGVRSIDATTTELCGKLAELGHPCE